MIRVSVCGLVVSLQSICISLWVNFPFWLLLCNYFCSFCICLYLISASLGAFLPLCGNFMIVCHCIKPACGHLCCFLHLLWYFRFASFDSIPSHCGYIPSCCNDYASSAYHFSCLSGFTSLYWDLVSLCSHIFTSRG